MKKVKILNITFENTLSFSEISKFRGAIISKLDDKKISNLFHNHTDSGFRYKYPLIQYKVFNKKASIICIAEGVEQIHDYFSSENHTLLIGNRSEEYKIDSIKVHEFTMQVWDKWFNYSLINWLALNSENHKKYETFSSEMEKEEFIENILKANILSFAKGIEWSVDKTINLRINSINRIKKVNYKDQMKLAFDIEFKTNVFLPNYMGLGKGVSTGFGTVKQIYQKENK